MKIKQIKKNKTKYIIVLDNDVNLTLYEEVILEFDLLYNKTITDEQLKEISERNTFYEGYYKAVNKLLHQRKSEYEIKNLLESNNVSAKYQKEIFEKLKKIKLINDEEYAKAYVNDKLLLTLDGPNKIRHSLEVNRINDQIIDAVINNISKERIHERIEKIIAQKTKQPTKYSPNLFKQKLYLYLFNKGYSSEDINSHIDNVEIKINNNEMDKIYASLSKKYTGLELINKLKNKLYQKKFTINEINEYIEKIEI